MCFLTRIKRVLRAVDCLVKHRYFPYRVYWVAPTEIRYVTPASPWVDVEQHKKSLNHPHAFLNRGYFFEDERTGSVLDGNWDTPRVPFNELLEYESLRRVIFGEAEWNHTPFAHRALSWLEEGNPTRGFATPEHYRQVRPKEVKELIDSISAFGVERRSRCFLSRRFADEIGVNVARDGELLFNNRGHDRVAIAKLLSISSIPVVPIVWHSDWVNLYGRLFPSRA